VWRRLRTAGGELRRMAGGAPTRQGWHAAGREIGTDVNKDHLQVDVQ